MNRRQAMTAAAAGVAAAALIQESDAAAPEQENPDNLPVVRFDRSGKIANMDEIEVLFPDFEPKHPLGTKHKSILVWVRRDKPVFINTGASDSNIWYGEMSLYRFHYGNPRRGTSYNFSKTDNSLPVFALASAGLNLGETT